MKKLLITLYPFIKLFKNHQKENVITRGSVFITLVKLAFLKRLNKSTGKVNVRIGRFLLTSPDYETLSFLIKEKFVDEQYYFKETNLKPVIFDCGSSIGISVLYFKCLYQGSEIYSFEPNPAAFGFLKMNVINNNLTNIHCYNLALSFEEDTIDLFIPKQNSFINSKATKIDVAKYDQISVSAKSLSEFLLPLQEVHLVKIDVEGSELDIIEDLKKEVLKRRIVKKFIIEYHVSIHPDKATLNNFLTTFTNHGYLYKFIDEYKNEVKGDKLILAYLEN